MKRRISLPAFATSLSAAAIALGLGFAPAAFADPGDLARCEDGNAAACNFRIGCDGGNAQG